ncbi:NAD(P)/FAD-dependent oxidoreductase [Roseimarinus sediminis]|jgi:NADH dehydrogenase|uniref:NAD(P)/FAD-dependent oxidoreductase n=1 Tax=Roseimarinus sediminis TaxID=1610899 RepID=UPI003D232EA5
MAINIPRTEEPRVVIVGAGFAGLKLARKLLNKGFQIVLIDQNNYHQFQPLLYQVATSGLEPSAISFPLRKIFQKEKNIHVRIAKVEEVIPERKKVKTSLGKLKYDYLVLSTGATTNYFGMDSFEKFTIPMKSTAEAVYLRNTLLLNFEKAVTISNEAKLRKIMNVVVVGGGPTGVEICGALAEMRKFVLPKDYPHINFDLMHITLIEAQAHLLQGMNPESGEKARRYLEEMGISVLTNHKVTDYNGELLTLENGRKIESETLVWAAGIKGQMPDGLSQSILARGNRVNVNRFNQVNGFEHIYAIGDIACMETEKYPHGHPQVAQVALQQARQLAYNLIALQKNKALKPFEYHDRGSMATIGRNRAVVDLPRFRFSGFPAWMVWMFVHLMSIVGVKNRLIIFINWLWSYITFDQSLRLILKPSAKAKQRAE